MRQVANLVKTFAASTMVMTKHKGFLSHTFCGRYKKSNMPLENEQLLLHTCIQMRSGQLYKPEKADRDRHGRCCELGQESPESQREPCLSVCLSACIAVQSQKTAMLTFQVSNYSLSAETATGVCERGQDLCCHLLIDATFNRMDLSGRNWVFGRRTGPLTTRQSPRERLTLFHPSNTIINERPGAAPVHV